uniref:Uncharacterized protein n=1 Tax=Rhizophora mucronata TaxID=61149 RepID=A0A2P2R0E7_RHIMU
MILRYQKATSFMMKHCHLSSEDWPGHLMDHF